MRELRTETTIDASADDVYGIITDLKRYVEWNPFILSAQGRVAQGERLRIRIQPAGKPAQPYVVTLVRVVPGKEIAWLGHFGLPGLIDGFHVFEIHPEGALRTRLVHREEFRGVLVPFVWGSFLNTRMRESFVALNQKLKERCELHSFRKTFSDMGHEEGSLPTSLQTPDWDWIVIGTGIGGATFGHAMARAGRNVLFIEKGADLRADRETETGGFLESLHPHPAVRRSKDYIHTGRSELKLWDAHRSRWIAPILGSGTGGSSALFGMVMERFWKEDFEPRRWHPGSKSTLPNRWPITFKEMEPYYWEAESLYGVSSRSVDPLRADQPFHYLQRPPLKPEGAGLIQSFQKQGLHPYSLPLARDWGTPCGFCQSYLCEHDCKNDAAKIGLEPALQHHRASLLSQTEALEITSSGRRVTGVTVRVGGRIQHLRSANVALSAGAILTPILLLKSKSPEWPNGLANESGLVGRNLMRHYIDLVGVSSRSPANEKGDQKELGFNDFYLHEGRKYGTVADFGKMPPLSVILEDLDKEMAAAGEVARTLWRAVRPIARWALDRLLQRKRFLAILTEDLPFEDNRVELGAHGADVTIHYSVRKEERIRIDRARALTRRALKSFSPLLLANAENTKLLAHACGTCRMGADPLVSVVDRYNRAHGVENLYIVDASFFPSSGGTNPALTIAANALRVANHLTTSAERVPVQAEGEKNRVVPATAFQPLQKESSLRPARSETDL